MKKTFANIRTLAALLIASAALAACSNEDSGIISEQPAQEQGPQVYTLTIQAGKADNAQTRALALDDPSDPASALSAKWTEGDKVDVYDYSSKIGELTASNVSTDGKTCTFSGTLTEAPYKGETLHLYYNRFNSIGDIINQDGTLASASKFDLAAADVTVASVSTDKEITIEGGTALFQTYSDVLKITMEDASQNKINATKLTLKIGGSITILEFSPTAEVYSTNGDGVLYFALPDQKTLAALTRYETTFFDNNPFTFTAEDGTNTYNFPDKKYYHFKGGDYYTTTLSMVRRLSEATADDIGKIAGADGRIYNSKADANKKGEGNAVAVIAYVGSATGDDTYNHGLAIALEDESGNPEWSVAVSTCNEKNAVKDASWRLTSKDNWDKMFIANGGDGTSCSGLNSIINTAGGHALENVSYWTSTAGTGEYVWAVNFGAYGVEGAVTYTDVAVKSWNYRVRACLAF